MEAGWTLDASKMRDFDLLLRVNLRERLPFLSLYVLYTLDIYITYLL
jgi:hypothetical protein